MDSCQLISLWNTLYSDCWSKGKKKRYSSHKKSHSSKLRQIQMYVNAHMFPAISLKHSNATFLTPVHVLTLDLSLFLTHGVARQRYWPNLGLGPKGLRNPALDRGLAFYILSWYMLRRNYEQWQKMPVMHTSVHRYDAERISGCTSRQQHRPVNNGDISSVLVDRVT